MAQLSVQADERARKNVASILQALAASGQSNVAKDLELSESAVSRMKDKDIPEAARLLAAVGLKVVPEKYRCVDAAYLAGLEHFAKCWLEHITQNQTPSPEGLKWD
jgi:hypothetical protein